MKAINGFLMASLMGSMAFAGVTAPKAFLDKVAELNITSDPPNQGPVTPILRQAKIKYEISAWKASKDPQGKPIGIGAIVCEGIKTIDVRGEGPINIPGPNFSCPTIYNNLPAEVGVFAVVSEGNFDFFSGRSSLPTKRKIVILNGYLNLKNSVSQPYPEFNSSTASIEASARSIQLISGSQLWDCSLPRQNCTPKWDESFSVTIELID